MNKTFSAHNPQTGQSVGAQIQEWDQAQTQAAITAADKVKSKLAQTDPIKRSAILNAIADAIEEQKDYLAQIANLETALPLDRKSVV